MKPCHEQIIVKTNSKKFSGADDGVGIDHNISLCLGDDEICCSPARKIPITRLDPDRSKELRQFTI